MKSKLSILFLISLTLFLSGCTLDESFESTQQNDGDDIDIINDIGPQALDQALNSEDIQPSSTATVSPQPSIQQIQSNPIATESEDDYVGEDD